MTEAKFIPTDRVEAWLEELTGRMRVLVPVSQGDAVIFAPFAPGARLELAGQTTVGPKAAVFPAGEDLLRYEYRKDPDDPARVGVDVIPVITAEPTLVFGCRPCDARGFAIFDLVYDGARYKDPYYLARRQATVFASIACLHPANTCFCHSVGGGPGDAQEADLLLTPVDDGYVVEASGARGPRGGGSEGGLLDSSLLERAGERAPRAAEARERALSGMGRPAEYAPAREKLMGLFDDTGFWEDVSAKCISCGACTYLCPTCYCFNITDEAAGLSGRRVRSWDNCMSHQFTLEASGHNPRPTKAHRLKNRVGHKFSYFPAVHGGLISCCGCGRCIKSCPMSVDIREIVARAMAHVAPAVKEGGS